MRKPITKKFNLGCIISGVFFILYSIVLTAINTFAGSLMVFAIGLLFIYRGSLYHKTKHLKPFKFLNVMCLIGISCLSMLLLFVFVNSHIHTTNYDEDAIIVLGCGLRGYVPSRPLQLRLDTAIKYHIKNPDAMVLVSGGQGRDEAIAEAEAMYIYLVQNGVNPDKIILEDKSTSTNENFEFSKPMLDNMLGNNYTVAYTTNSFHMYRAGKLAKLNGLEDVTGCRAPTALSTVFPDYLRETLAVIQLWFFNK